MRNILRSVILALCVATPPAVADVIKTIQAGATDQSVTLRIIDSTDGTPETGVVFNTAGIDLEYWRHGANAATDITEATQTANGAHADGGFVHIGHGVYRLDLPDAAVASGATAVDVYGTVTGMIVIGGTVQLSTDTPQTGDSFARLGAPAGASIAADLVTIDNFVDDLESRLGTPANLGGGATVAQNLSDIEGQTDDIGAAGAGLTALASQSSVNAIDDFVDTEVAAILAAVDTEIAAILDDTGTSGVVIAEATANCREVLGCDTQGTLSGTHSTTTADLGTNAPANDIEGMTLIIPTHNFSRVITSYDTGTGVATFSPATAETLANGNQYYVVATAPVVSSGSGATAQEVWEYATRSLTILDEDSTTIDLNATPVGAAASVTAAVTVGTNNDKTGYALSAAGVDAVWDEATSGHVTAGTYGVAVTDILTDTSTTLDDFVDDLETRIGTPANLGGGATVAANLSDIEAQTDDIGAAGAGLTAADDAVMTRLGTPAGASVSADIAAIEAQTDDIGAAGAGLTALASASDLATVDQNVDDIESRLGTPSDFGSGTSSIAANLQDLADNGTATFDRTTDSLQAIRDRGDAAWTGGGGGTADWTTDERAAMRTILGIPASGTTPDDPTDGILDDIRDAVASGGGGGLDAAGVRAAIGLTSPNLDTQLSGIQSDTNDIQTRLPAALVSGRMDASTGAMAANVMTAAAAAPDLTTELQTGLATSAAVAALNDLDSTEVQTAAAAALTAYDPPTRTEATSDANSILTAVGDVPTNAELATALAGADDATLAAVAALNDATPAEIWSYLIEDQGGGIEARCAVAAILALVAGDVVTVGTTSTYEEPSGTETRVVSIVVSNGNRTSTITCPTY